MYMFEFEVCPATPGSSPAYNSLYLFGVFVKQIVRHATIKSIIHTFSSRQAGRQAGNVVDVVTAPLV